MGQSTNAIMAFGFNLAEEDDELKDMLGIDPDADFEADEFLLRLYRPEFPEWTPDGPPDWHVKQRAELEAIPVDIIMHCSGDYPMYFLAVRGTDITARRGSPVEAIRVDVAQEQIDALRAFCERYDIEWKDPFWHIFSMWN